MTGHLSEDDLARLSASLMDQLGLHFPRERWQDMERGIRSAARDFDFPDPGSCVEWLLASPLSRRQIEVLASHLTVGETYFFREKAAFEVLEERILPEVTRSRRENGERLRIWSAGCASGEEPYSIAIALDRRMGGEQARKAMILATDINPRSLDRAAAGVYGDWSFRDAPPHLKEVYFRKEGRHYEILRTIKQQVLFSFLNLAEDAYPTLASNTNAMDVIFCRNVLMYFSPQQAQKVVQKFYRSLVDGGWLIVSPCEASSALFSQFTAWHFPGATLYQKNAAASAQAMKWFSAPQPVPVEQQEYSDLPPLRAAPDFAGAASVEAAGLPASGLPSPQAPPQPYEAARALYEKGCYAQVIELLGACPEPPGQTAEANALAARAFANQGKLSEALARCERAIELEKVHAGHHYLRAAILIEQGALDEARQALKRALYLDPDFVLAHLALANLARQRSQPGACARHLEIARGLLSARAREELLPESEGITAGRLLEIIEAQRGAQPNNGQRFRAKAEGAAPAAGFARAWRGGAR
jgi:chemotaxis protein methyltransferase CheR